MRLEGDEKKQNDVRVFFFSVKTFFVFFQYTKAGRNKKKSIQKKKKLPSVCR